MKTINDYISLINSAYQSLDYKIKPKTLCDPIEYLISSGGKRIRACFTLIAYQLYKKNLTSAINTALAIELFHNFTLMHDDIMDKAPLRRGKPTVYAKWNLNTAILSGDAMMIKSYDLLNEAINDVPEIFTVFNFLATEVCQGQQLDLDFESLKLITVEDYIEMITKKTAVLLGGSLKIGAMQAGAPKQDIDYLYEFGKNIGIAFQLMDDYLDVFAPDSEKFGKKLGGDIVANKKTFLLLKALQVSKNKNSSKDLENILSMKQLEPERKISWMRQIYRDLKVDQLTLKEIEFYYNASLSYLDSVEIDTGEKQILEIFAKQIKNRVF